MTGSYPASASITREFMAVAGQRNTSTNPDTGTTFETSPVHPHFYALKTDWTFMAQEANTTKFLRSMGIIYTNCQLDFYSKYFLWESH